MPVKFQIHWSCKTQVIMILVHTAQFWIVCLARIFTYRWKMIQKMCPTTKLYRTKRSSYWLNFINFGLSMLQIWIFEMDRLRTPCFRKTENWFHVVARIGQNQKGIRKSVQNEKWSLTCLVCPCKILDYLELWKNWFMLKNHGPAGVHIRIRIDSYVFMLYAYRKSRKSLRWTQD